MHLYKCGHTRSGQRYLQKAFVSLFSLLLKRDRDRKSFFSLPRWNSDLTALSYAANRTGFSFRLHRHFPGEDPVILRDHRNLQNCATETPPAIHFLAFLPLKAWAEQCVSWLAHRLGRHSSACAEMLSKPCLPLPVQETVLSCTVLREAYI